MGWIFDLFFKDDKPKQWQLKLLDGRVLFEGTQNECKSFYEENIEDLVARMRLKYIFKSYCNISIKIDLLPIYEKYKQDNYF